MGSGDAFRFGNRGGEWVFTWAATAPLDRCGVRLGGSWIVFKVGTILRVQQELFGGLQPLNLPFYLQDQFFHVMTSSVERRRKRGIGCNMDWAMRGDGSLFNSDVARVTVYIVQMKNKVAAR